MVESAGVGFAYRWFVIIFGCVNFSEWWRSCLSVQFSLRIPIDWERAHQSVQGDLRPLPSAEYRFDDVWR